MGISEQTLEALIEEGSQLIQTGCKIQESRAIHWYIKSKTTLDQLNLQPETMDPFRDSLNIEERVKIMRTISDNSSL